MIIWLTLMMKQYGLVERYYVIRPGIGLLYVVAGEVMRNVLAKNGASDILCRLSGTTVLV
jgi:hypothetical protein